MGQTLSTKIIFSKAGLHKLDRARTLNRSAADERYKASWILSIGQQEEWMNLKGSNSQSDVKLKKIACQKY